MSGDQSDHDPYDLGRFVRAQEGVHEQALAELASGRKRSHWMWFVFPQLAGLGRSATAQRYAVEGLAEAGRSWRTPCSGPGCSRPPGPRPPHPHGARTTCSAGSTR